MNKLLTFEKDFIRSCYSTKFYKELIKKPLSYSLKCFSIYSIFYALIATLIVWVRFIMPISPILQTLPSRLASAYPSELEVTIKDGVASTNVEEPYFIPISDLKKEIYQIRDDILGTDTYALDYLIVVDTNATIDEFTNYKTLAFLTQNYLIYYSEDSSNSLEQFSVINLDQLDDMVINQNTVDQMATFSQAFFEKLPLILLLVVLLYFVSLLPLFRLIHILFISLISYVLSAIIKPQLKLKKIYQLTTHVYLIAITISGLFILTSINLPFANSPTTITLVGTVLVLFYLRKTTQKKKRIRSK